MPEVVSPGWSVLAALVLFIVASVWLGALAQRRIEKGSFLQGFFLGNRSIGAWAMALTATVQSGGTFMGFPALVYSHGWVVTLWIAGYMVLPLTGFAFVGKRLAQISRRSGAITVPDLVRARFDSPAAGVIASLLILVFMMSAMIAQFKAGAIVMKLAWPGSNALAMSEDVVESPEVELAPEDGKFGEMTEKIPEKTDWPYLIGLVIFSLTVVGYTMIGGFLASVWTDLFQSIMMLFGVLVLLVLTVPAAGGLEQATRDAVAATGPEFAFGPGYEPGGRAFVTTGLAFSFFIIWNFAGFATPASIVRVMATESTHVLRKSIALLACYNLLIYLPLIAICIAGRALMPALDKPDEIIPRLALTMTSQVPGGPFVGGLILAAPFGAVMATVSCYLLVIASGLVKDLYLRFIRPAASVREIRIITYVAMIVVGGIAVGANIRPVTYLQALIVFSGASGAATFVVPVFMAAYWRRANAPGAIAAMVFGGGTMFALFALGALQRFANAAIAAPDASPLMKTLAGWLGPDPMIGMADPFKPYYFGGVDAVLWALAASLIAGIGATLLTRAPAEEHVSRFFDAEHSPQARSASKDD